MNRSSFSILIIFILLVICFGCKKDPYDQWEKDHNIVTYRLEYNIDKQLIKQSRYNNGELSNITAFDYYDTCVIRTNYNNNSEPVSRVFFVLDSNHRTVMYYNVVPELKRADTITYSESGFPNEITFNYDTGSFYMQDNGEDITSEGGNLLIIEYIPSDTIAKVDLPYDIYQLLSYYTGLFGKRNNHLLRSYSQSTAGPGSYINTIRFEYIINSEGYVTQVKKYKKGRRRYEEIPTSGTISIIRYEYVFEE